MLYLRLNGYFVSGFIVHAPGQGNLTQVDVLAVRFPNNSEPERAIRTSAYLQTSESLIDFLICEVKGGKGIPNFNEALKENDEAVGSILRWMGAFTNEEIQTLIEPVKQLLSFSGQNSDEFPTHACPRQHRIRAVLFAPDRANPIEGEPRYISGDEIVKYIGDCLHPVEPRSHCSVRYDFGLWGDLEPIVKVFKEAPSQPSVNEICNKLLKSSDI